MIESAEHIMQAAAILGRQEGEVLNNQRLMLWYHLGRQRCALFGQTQQICTPIIRMRLARYGTLATPQLGQIKPFGQRRPSR